ncbi:MAG TPA: hypothetical protein VNN80_30155 [Polyangiaceae bacterium]|nr:hypothetical protein [Polyangiaceae bacterium]
MPLADGAAAAGASPLATGARGDGLDSGFASRSAQAPSGSAANAETSMAALRTMIEFTFLDDSRISTCKRGRWRD